jgi:preprotein translocase subunit SecA
MRGEVIDTLIKRHIPENAYADQWDAPGLKSEVLDKLNLDLPVVEWAAEEGIDEQDIRARLNEAADAAMAARVAKAAEFGPDVMAYVERTIVLQTLDGLWREHLVNLDHLRSVIGFRGYAQRDPLQEYKGEAFELFQTMLANLRERVTQQLMRFELVREAPRVAPGLPPLTEAHPAADMFADGVDDEAAAQAFADQMVGSARNPNDPSSWGKVARNEPCPCGSGKKYKNCHGAMVADAV